jgi:hypothetical protein
VSGNITTSGSASFPSSAQSLSTWGFSATWGASDPNPSSTDSLYQSDGIYDPNTGNTVWTTPYISSLKVGTLSAITVNTGALTVQDILTLNTLGKIRGGQTDYNAGTGFFLGYSGAAYKFSIGSSAQSLLWDGTSLTINGNIVSSGKAEFVGNNGDLLGTAVKANQTGAADVGVAGYAGSSTLGRGISGFASASSTVGVVGSISSSAARAAILANCTGTATTALEIAGGKMVIDNSTLVVNLNADLLDGKNASAFVEIASGVTNGQYIYFVNNNTAPTDPNNRAAWIRLSTNDGGYVYFPGYL